MSIKLPKKLQKAPFSYSEAIQAGLSRYQLGCLLENESIERLDRGVYQSTSLDLSEENQFRRATLVMGDKSAICLLSALSFYQLTDIIPKKVWIMVDAKKRSRNKNLKILRKRNAKWSIGIIKTRQYQITSVERTLIDCLLDASFPKAEVLSSIRLAITNQMTDGTKILKMAEKLKVKDKVLPYLQAIV